MKKGFTLIEILVAIFFFAVAVLSLFRLNQFSNRGAMDAVYEAHAIQLAQEPLEIFGAFGYEWLKKYINGLIPPLAEDFKIGEWCLVRPVFLAKQQMLFRPVESALFRRLIKVTPMTPQADSANALLIEVMVEPLNKKASQRWLSRKYISLRSILSETSP